MKRLVGLSAAVGRTVRPFLADPPPGRRGPSAWFVGKRGGTGRSGGNNGPSAHLADRPQGHRGQSTHVARRWVPGRGEISHQLSFLFPKPQETFIPLSFLLSLKKRPSPWGFRLGHSPDRPSISPDSPRDSPPCHPGIFFAYPILSLSDFEQEGD
jgi:hypothetical protein